MAAKKKASGPKLTKTGLAIDLTGVEASERRRKKRIPEGNYTARVDKVYPKKFKSDNRGVVWEFVVTGGNPKGKGARFWYNNTLIDKDGEVMENTLWSLRGVLQALSPAIKIKDSMMNIPFDKLVDRTCALEIADDEDDEGTIRSTIIDVFAESLLEEEEEDEDEDEEEEEDEDFDDEEDDAEEEEDDEEEAKEEAEDDEEEFDLDEDEL